LPQPSDPVRDVLLSHIPEFGSARNPCDVTAQILANPESLNACADALLGDQGYSALVVPQTYGYAPSARRIPVYDSLAAKHGKIACLAWQSEWLEGLNPRSQNTLLCSARCHHALQRWQRGIGAQQNAQPEPRTPCPRQRPRSGRPAR
jgi:acetate---CoA ligase (ADP-forming)